MTDHINLFDAPPPTYTEEELANLDLIRRYRAAKVSERKPFFAPGFVRHRAGFANIADLWGGPGGMDDDSVRDRQNILIDLTAKGDKVWGIWRVVGTHTGNLYGIPATNRPIDVIEVGLWRCENGLIAEAWYFGDDLGLVRQLGVEVPGH